METRKVVEMIDAITEGMPYELEIDSATYLKLRETDFSFIDEQGGELVAPSVNPRTAREIAAALVAWADRKDGSISRTAGAILGAIRWAEFKGDIESTPANCNYPKIWKASATHRRHHNEHGECSFEKEDPESDV
jgi:hypothetical protein